MANVYGIDVSEHNGTLDWGKIKASGISFAIIRTGYGTSHTDTQFHKNMQGALSQGLPVGVYHFSYALNAEGARKEADFVLSLLKPYKEKITLPVFFDFEYDTIRYGSDKGVALGRQAFNDHTVVFCDRILEAGYRAGTYYNLDYKNRFVDMARLKPYVQWYAQYNDTASWTGYDIWQKSSSHQISGHSGRFDYNVAPESFLNGKLPEGWVKDEKGWWYRRADGSYPKAGWEDIGGTLWRFDEDGYCYTNTTLIEGKTLYTFDENGYYTTEPIKESESAEAVTKPEVTGQEDYAMETRYHLLRDVTSKTYRATLDDLIRKGILQGKGGEGEDLILDLGEDAIRVLVYLDRAGVFGD